MRFRGQKLMDTKGRVWDATDHVERIIKDPRRDGEPKNVTGEFPYGDRIVFRGRDMTSFFDSLPAIDEKHDIEVPIITMHLIELRLAKRVSPEDMMRAAKRGDWFTNPHIWVDETKWVSQAAFDKMRSRFLEQPPEFRQRFEGLSAR